jgi:hypothetical protein
MYKTPVQGHEPLVRFIFDKSQYRSSDLSAKFSLFMPASKTNDVSVFRTEGLDETGCFELGETYVAPMRGKPILGLARLVAKDVFDQQLAVIGTRTPHPRHADIKGWPGDTENRLKAIHLAQLAKLVLA